MDQPQTMRRVNFQVRVLVRDDTRVDYQVQSILVRIDSGECTEIMANLSESGPEGFWFRQC